MQLIASKTLPPFPSFLINALAKENARANRKVVLRLGIKYCPSMDLVATYPILIRDRSLDDQAGAVEDEERKGFNYDDEESVSVDVWRLNGQKVFAIDVEGEDGRVNVCDVAWRDDGQLLAILASDNVVRLVNSFTGKVVFRFPSLSAYRSPQSPASSFRKSQQSRLSSGAQHIKRNKQEPSVGTFSTHFTDPLSITAQLDKVGVKEGTTLDNLLSLNADIGKLLKFKADLPKELASIDVEAFLPKLSCLPPAGFGAEDVFSTRNAIDAIFHSSKRNLNSGIVDVLSVGTTNGTIHLRMFDSFEIGDIDLTTATRLPKDTVCGGVHRILSHPFMSRSIVLVELLQSGKQPQVHLLSLDLKFITQYSTSLPILATKSAQLHNLLRYLTQIQSQLAREVKSAFDIPTRFIRNLNEDLEKQEGENSSFTTAAYHAIVTGNVNGAFKEWLAEVLGERGAKRWEKAVSDCLELVRRLVSENWNPAAERAGVVISRLEGLAECHIQGDGDGTGFGIDKKVVEALRETVDVMALFGEELVKDVNHELHGFASFVKWLKWEVEAACLEDTSERLDEMRESSDHSETLKVLEYINNGPTDTVVRKYISNPAGGQQGDDDNDDVEYLARIKELRRRSVEQRKIPTFDQLTARMNRQCERFFEQVALNLRKSIMVEYITILPTMMDTQVMDTRIIPQASNGELKPHFIARNTGEGGSMLYGLLDQEQKQTKNSTTTVVIRLMEVPQVKEITDIKFIDDTSFMVLVQTSVDARIYSRTTISHGAVEDAWELRHCFPHGLMESGMKPAKLEMNGRKNRRAVAVVDEEGRGYSIFDLDSGDADEEGGDDDLVMGD